MRNWIILHPTSSFFIIGDPHSSESFLIMICFTSWSVSHYNDLWQNPPWRRTSIVLHPVDLRKLCLFQILLWENPLWYSWEKSLWDFWENSLWDLWPVNWPLREKVAWVGWGVLGIIRSRLLICGTFVDSSGKAHFSHFHRWKSHWLHLAMEISFNKYLDKNGNTYIWMGGFMVLFLNVRHVWCAAKYTHILWTYIANHRISVCTLPGQEH